MGQLVDILQAVDLDGDQLWYSIIGKILLLGNRLLGNIFLLRNLVMS